jgi:hypothetical protein
VCDRRVTAAAVPPCRQLPSLLAPPRQDRPGRHIGWALLRSVFVPLYGMLAVSHHHGAGVEGGEPRLKKRPSPRSAVQNARSLN